MTNTRGRVRPGTRSLHVWSGQAGLEIKSVGEPTCPCQGSPGQALKGFLSIGGGGGGVRGLSAVRLRSTKNQGETVDLSKVQNRAESGSTKNTKNKNQERASHWQFVRLGLKKKLKKTRLNSQPVKSIKKYQRYVVILQAELLGLATITTFQWGSCSKWEKLYRYWSILSLISDLSYRMTKITTSQSINRVFALNDKRYLWKSDLFKNYDDYDVSIGFLL